MNWWERAVSYVEDFFSPELPAQDEQSFMGTTGSFEAGQVDPYANVQLTQNLNSNGWQPNLAYVSPNGQASAMVPSYVRRPIESDFFGYSKAVLGDKASDLAVWGATHRDEAGSWGQVLPLLPEEASGLGLAFAHQDEPRTHTLFGQRKLGVRSCLC
jgi:hypothetical protein